MKRRILLTLAAVLALPALAAPEAPYNEQADARAELNQALAQAAQHNKKVLVVYGANWCKDCLALDRGFAQGKLAGEVGKRYVVLKVNVGRFDRNVDLAQQMGVTLKKGIPTVAVLGADGQVQGSTLGGELADARNMGEEAVLKVLAEVGRH